MMIRNGMEWYCTELRYGRPTQYIFTGINQIKFPAKPLGSFSGLGFEQVTKCHETRIHWTEAQFPLWKSARDSKSGHSVGKVCSFRWHSKENMGKMILHKTASVIHSHWLHPSWKPWFTPWPPSPADGLHRCGTALQLPSPPPWACPPHIV